MAAKNEGEKRVEAVEKAIDNLNKLLDEAYDAGDSIRVSMISRVSGGKRRTEQNHVFIE